MVQRAMGFLDSAPNKDVQLKTIDTLRIITAGKVFVSRLSLCLRVLLSVFACLSVCLSFVSVRVSFFAHFYHLSIC
jgi:hypothetical protein